MLLLRFLFHLWIICIANFVFADGLPLNQERTHVLGKIEVLELNSQQQKEVSRTRILKLTKAQRSRLQKIARACPAVLQILTNRYDDCTCGMSSYAVWFGKGLVEIPIFALQAEPMTKEEIEDFGDGIPKPPEILIDEHLQIWVKGEMVSEKKFQQKLLNWKKLPPNLRPRNESGQLQVTIETPPILGPELEKRLVRLVERLRAFTSKQDIDLFIWGFRAVGQ